MAESIGIASGLLAFVTFALQSTQVLSDVIQTYKNAPSILADLDQDVNATRATLTAIKNSIDRNDDNSFSESVRKCLQESKPAIEGCGKACEDFSKELKDVMSHSKDGKVSARDRVKLWIEEDTIKGFRYRLGSYKSTLNIVLTLASLKAIDSNKTKSADLQKDLEKAVSTMTGQIQGLTMLTSKLNLFEAGEEARGKELVLYQDSLSSQKAELAECLKTCSYTLAEVASQTGTTVEHAEAIDDATQLLGTFGDIKGTDFAAASTAIKKMIAKDNAFQAAGTFSENAFFQALSRNKKSAP